MAHRAERCPEGESETCVPFASPRGDTCPPGSELQLPLPQFNGVEPGSAEAEREKFTGEVTVMRGGLRVWQLPGTLYWSDSKGNPLV